MQVLLKKFQTNNKLGGSFSSVASMKLYLSSYGFGNQVDKLKAFASNRCIGFIPNALDHVEAEGGL